MKHPFFKVQALSKSFGGMEILKDVYLELYSGEIVSIFGDNGSGKTTLFHLLSGFLVADKGKIQINGQELSGLRPIRFSQAGIGRSWQNPRIFKNATVIENLMIAIPNHPGSFLPNYLLKRSAIAKSESDYNAKAHKVAAQIELEGKLGKTAGELSFGEQKLLSIGMLLMQDPKLLLLDEPFAGINPNMIRKISQLLDNLRAPQLTIMMIEHHHQFARSISQRTFVLENGQLLPDTV